MSFLAQRLSRIKPVATSPSRPRPPSSRRRARRHRPRRRRARFRHARHIQEAGSPRCARRDRYTAVDGTPVLKQAICRQVQARETGPTTSQPDHRRHPAASRCSTTRLMATLDCRRRRFVVPAPYWVSYPDIVAALRRDAGRRQLPAEQRLQAPPRGSRRGDQPRTKWAHPQLAVEPDRGRLHGG